MALPKRAIAKQLGSLIKKLRMESPKKMTQGQFGREVLDRPEEDDSACQSWVSRIELGNFTTQLNERVILKIAKVLDIEPDKMLELWAEYNNIVEEEPITNDVDALKLPSNIQRKFPKLQGYFDSFYALTKTEDPKAMVGTLESAIKYLNTFDD